MAKTKKLVIKVLFDTSAIYTASSSDLLSREVQDLINNHSSLSDISLIWYLPEIVIKERIFQMNKKGSELLPSIQKLERILNHNLNITKETIEFNIAENVRRQIASFRLESIKVDTSKVDWEMIIDDSVNRRPPFQDNEKEKGFRDAMILECFKRLLVDSPSTKSICRVVLLTNDDLLNKAASQCLESRGNVDIFSKVEELVSLINILNSAITEDVVKAIIPDAGRLFFQENKKDTLYFSEGVSKSIREKFSEELKVMHEGADSRENGTWSIHLPGFEKKDKQRCYWKTIIEVDFESFKTIYEPQNQGFPSGSYLLGGTGILGSGPGYATIGPGIGLASSANIFAMGNSVMGLSSRKEKVGNGKTRFEVLWSATLTTAKRLKSPKLEDIKFLDTIFK